MEEVEAQFKNDTVKLFQEIHTKGEGAFPLFKLWQQKYGEWITKDGDSYLPLFVETEEYFLSDAVRYLKFRDNEQAHREDLLGSYLEEISK